MIEFNNVSFTYQGKRRENGIHNVSFQIQRGEVILICGGSGCGKSTVTRIINGLIPHFYEGKLEGDFKINSELMNNKTLYEINRNIGSVFQNPRTQFFNLDTEGELFFGCENRGMDTELIMRNRQDSIEKFHLEELMSRSIFKLSGGQQQRVACASAYCSEPDIFVLDEPTSNLDECSIDELKEILATVKASGKTIVIAEHRLYFLMDLVDRIFYMDKGELIHIFSRKEFLDLSRQETEIMGLRSTRKTSINELDFLGNKNHKREEFLEIHNMKAFYKDDQEQLKEVLNINDLKIPLGEIVAIIGNNGIGKTTFAQTVAGLQKNAKAEIYFHARKMKHKERTKLSYLVMQDVNHQLFTDSVMEEIKLGAKVPAEDIGKLLKAFELDGLKKEHPMSISGGQKQRVTIAAAISSGKRIVILDEPTSGLDYKQMVNVSEALKELQKKVDLILVITHDYEFINYCCTSIINMDK